MARPLISAPAYTGGTGPGPGKHYVPGQGWVPYGAPAPTPSAPKTPVGVDPTTGQPYQPSPTDPLGEGPHQPSVPGQAGQLSVAGYGAGSQLYNIGMGIDPTTGKPISADVPGSLAARYYGEAAAPIESGFFKQSHDVASYLARQGLGASPGINIGASSSLASNKEALEGQARLKAADLAQSSMQQGVLNDLSAQLMGSQPNMALYMQQQSIQAQIDMMEQQMMGQMLSGLGSLAGLGLMA